jgi:hypothetical protein
LKRLPDGRFYAVMRVETNTGYGGQFHHAWSEDEGRTWSQPVPLVLQDEPEHIVRSAWPVMTQLPNGTLILAYGRPGKNLVFDPSGTGTQWQGRLDLHALELDTQALMGVPPEQRLRGIVGEDWSKRMDRHTDSGDYLGVVATGENELLVVYDVHAYVELMRTGADVSQLEKPAGICSRAVHRAADGDDRSGGWRGRLVSGRFHLQLIACLIDVNIPLQRSGVLLRGGTAATTATTGNQQ